ncbi:MAG TPA: enoyl-CoA hydratase/isomerase family protein [Candidatus Angelobacter sp.]
MNSSTLKMKRIALELDGRVARIHLDHAPVNVFDLPMMDELFVTLQELEARSEVSAIILSGSKRAFSAGVDVAIHTPDKTPAMLQKFHGLIGLLAKLRKVTIAEVRGMCLGGGAELAMICDLVYTADNATWGFPEITLGCYPPVACTALAALVGQKRAADLVLTGRSITGTEAAAWGLANEAHPEEELAKAVQSALDRLLDLSPAVLSVAKKAFYAWDSIHLDKGLARAEKIYVEELMQTQDAQEGINSWLEKRDPEWKGR